MNNIIPSAETYQTRILAILNQENLPTNAQDERIEAIVTEIFNNLGHSNEVRTAVSNLILPNPNEAPLSRRERVARIVENAALASQMGAPTFTIGTRTEQKSEQKTEQESHRSSVKTYSMKTREKREKVAEAFRQAAREQQITRDRVIHAIRNYYLSPASEFALRTAISVYTSLISSREQDRVIEIIRTSPQYSQVAASLDNFLDIVSSCHRAVTSLGQLVDNPQTFCEAASRLTPAQISFVLGHHEFPNGYNLIGHDIAAFRCSLETDYISLNMDRTLDQILNRASGYPKAILFIIIDILRTEVRNSQPSNNTDAALEALNTIEDRVRERP